MTEPRVLRGTVDVGDRTVGYRRGGRGPAVVLLGSLSRTSAADLPLIAALAAEHTVVALDPPGYGFTDPLPAGAGGVGEVAAMAAAVSAVLTALGVDAAAVVGRHSGGAVAVELALRDPGRHPLLVLDDVPLLAADDRAAWARELGAAIPARGDGSHLLQHWYRSRQAYVHGPWFATASPLDLDLTGPDVLEAIHATVLDRLDAGGDTRGERAALEHDTVAALRATTVTVVAPTPSYAALGAPRDARPDVVTTPCSAELADRRAAVVAALRAWSDGPRPRHVSPEVARGRWTVQLPETPWGQVAARRFRPAHDAPDAVPLVLLHASPLSGESLLPLARELATTREVVVLDTLGNGDSDKPDPVRHPAFRVPEIADLARVALAAVAALGIDRYDVFGTHTGAMIGLEMGIAAPGRVASLVLDGLPLLEPSQREALGEDFHIDLTPRWDGGHLVAAWSNVVDVLTWYPWNRRDPQHRRSLTLPPTDVLDRRAVQMLKSGTSYVVSSAAVTRHATVTRLPLLAVPTAFCRTPGDPMATYADACQVAVDGSEVIERLGEPGPDAQRIADWLERRTVRVGCA